MTNFPILDLVLGMIFIFFLLSIISNSIIEMAMSISKARSKVLEEWLKRVLNDELAKMVMNHNSVTALSEENAAPSYIGAQNFSTALLERVSYDDSAPLEIIKNIDEIHDKISKSNLLPEELKRTLLIYISESKQTFATTSDKTKSEIDLFREKIENWFNSSMDRLSGAIKRKYARKFTLVTAVAIAVLMNADSISITKYLYDNPTATSKLASQATAAAQNEEFKRKVEEIRQAPLSENNQETLDSLINTIRENTSLIKENAMVIQNSIPIGWNAKEFSKNLTIYDWIWFILSKAIGICTTIAAICLGAPFWFDLLNKIGNVRSSGKPILDKNN